MAHVTVKLNDVLHDERPDNPELSIPEIESLIRRVIGRRVVNNVRIASGSTNSPIFIELEASNITPDTINKVARQAVQEFAKHFDGVDISHTVSDYNIVLRDLDE